MRKIFAIEMKKVSWVGCVNAVRNLRSAAALQAQDKTEMADIAAPALQPAEPPPQTGAPGTEGGNGCSVSAPGG